MPKEAAAEASGTFFEANPASVAGLDSHLAMLLRARKGRVLKLECDAAIDTAEREAIDQAFDNAVIKAQPQKINGATLYKALVFIDWTLDIECKRRKPGGGIPHGRPE